MNNKPDFTNTIEEWSNFFIPLSDGVQLAARAWLPTNAMAKQFKNRVLRIIEAEVVNRQTTNSPGEVIKYDKDICYVATSNGVINLKKVQLSGKKEVSIKDFNNAYQLINLK